MKYTVKYIIQTYSRAGKYNYNCNDIVEAENESAAKVKLKEIVPNKILFKKYKIIIKSVELAE